MKNLFAADLSADWPIPDTPEAPRFDPLKTHIWTNTKAQLIRNYLQYFVWVTRHGCYIDGFAGPQYPDEPDKWAAKLVLEMTPKFLREFFLCEIDSGSFQMLSTLNGDQPEIRNRKIAVHEGDFNEWVDEVLASGLITDKTATFALLDQRTFDCEWRTVEALANHKHGEHKIELFYFFPTGWIARALSKHQNDDKVDRWWGDDSWAELKGRPLIDAMGLMRQRLQGLGYKYVTPWPIHKGNEATGKGRVMYHMIHATDHSKAPTYMRQAYQKLVSSSEELELIKF